MLFCLVSTCFKQSSLDQEHYLYVIHSSVIESHFKLENLLRKCSTWNRFLNILFILFLFSSVELNFKHAGHQWNYGLLLSTQLASGQGKACGWPSKRELCSFTVNEHHVSLRERPHRLILTWGICSLQINDMYHSFNDSDCESFIAVERYVVLPLSERKLSYPVLCNLFTCSVTFLLKLALSCKHLCTIAWSLIELPMGLIFTL